MWPHSHTGPSLFPSSVQFSLSVVSNSATTWTPGFPVHHKLPELAQTHVHQVSDVIQPSHPVVLFSSHFQSFPALGSFPVNQFFASGGQNVGVSTSVLPMTIQDWFPLGLTGWISLQFKGLLKSLLQHHSSKASIFWRSTFFMVQISHPYMTTGKTIALTRQTFVGKMMFLLFNMLFRFVLAFLARSKCLLISWLQSPSAVILEPKKIKSVTVSIVFPFKFSRLILKTDVLLSTSYKIHHVYFLMHIINTCNDFCWHTM